MGYQVARENGRAGEAITLRAEINIGLKKGYAGLLQEKDEVISFLKEEYRKALENGGNYIPVGIQVTDIVYAYPSGSGIHTEAEPSLTLFSDKNPLYAVESDYEWKKAVESLVSKLAERFQQFRVYVTYMPVEVKIFQKEG